MKNLPNKKHIACSVLIALLCVSKPLTAQVPKFQALYLLNFSKNLYWDQQNIKIGVIGDSKALNELSTLSSKYPNVSFEKISSGSNVDGYHMLFLPSSQSAKFDLIQQKIGNSSTVLITEDSNLAAKGAEIAFYMDGNKLKFTLNKSALEASGGKSGRKTLYRGKSHQQLTHY